MTATTATTVVTIKVVDIADGDAIISGTEPRKLLLARGYLPNGQEVIASRVHEGHGQEARAAAVREVVDWLHAGRPTWTVVIDTDGPMSAGTRMRFEQVPPILVVDPNIPPEAKAKIEAVFARTVGTVADEPRCTCTPHEGVWFPHAEHCARRLKTDRIKIFRADDVEIRSRVNDLVAWAESRLLWIDQRFATVPELNQTQPPTTAHRLQRERLAAERAALTAVLKQLAAVAV